MQAKRNWRTRVNPFFIAKDEIENTLREKPFISAKDLFVSINSLYPGQFKINQMRTLQRMVNDWRDSNRTIENATNWLVSLMQGEINLDELIIHYKDLLEKNDLVTLNYCILFKGLKYRNKSVAILCHLKGAVHSLRLSHFCKMLQRNFGGQAPKTSHIRYRYAKRVWVQSRHCKYLQLYLRIIFYENYRNFY